jgi:hypothetical protein
LRQCELDVCERHGKPRFGIRSFTPFSAAVREDFVT